MFYNKPICPKLIDIALVLGVKVKNQVAVWIGIVSFQSLPFLSLFLIAGVGVYRIRRIFSVYLLTRRCGHNS